MKLKTLERTWKALSLRAICTAMRAGGSPGPVPDWRREPTRILFLRQDRIGDAIVSSGLLRAIKGVSPDLVIDALASPRNAEILRRDPSIQTVHVFDKRQPATFAPLVRQMRSAHYHAVIDCMVTAPSMTGLMLMIASGARHRIGIAGRGVDAGLTVTVPATADSEHIIDLLAAIGTVFGIDRAATNWRPALTLSDSERAAAADRWGQREGRRLLVNVSAGHPVRYWPAERYVATIKRLRERFESVQIRVIGAPAERSRAIEVARAAGVQMVDTPGLVDAIGLVATADCVLTPDTSIGHMASAFMTPAVVMFKDDQALKQWGLYGSPGINLASDGSLATLPMEPVVVEVERLLE